MLGTTLMCCISSQLWGPPERFSSRSEFVLPLLQEFRVCLENSLHTVINGSLCLYCWGTNFGSNHLGSGYIYKITAILVTKLFFIFALLEWHCNSCSKWIYVITLHLLQRKDKYLVPSATERRLSQHGGRCSKEAEGHHLTALMR